MITRMRVGLTPESPFLSLSLSFPQAELTRTYIKPPPNKTALDVPDRDYSSVGRVAGGGGGAGAAASSRTSGSNLLNFPYAHGMSSSQEALSTPPGSVGSGGGGGGAASKASSSSKQSNFPFSRFFKSRGSNTSINNSNGHAAKSRPESPCRYVASKSTSSVDLKQRLPLSSSSISLASTVYAGSAGLEPSVRGPTTSGGMVVDVTTTSSSTNYCVYVATSSLEASSTASASYHATTTTTHLPCDTTSRELGAQGPSTGAGGVAGERSCRGIYVETNAVHSITSYQAAGSHTAAGQQHPTVSSSAASSSSGRQLQGAAKAATPMASCDKRVYVEKRIKTSDSDSSTASSNGV